MYCLVKGRPINYRKVCTLYYVLLFIKLSQNCTTKCPCLDCCLPSIFCSTQKGKSVNVTYHLLPHNANHNKHCRPHHTNHYALNHTMGHKSHSTSAVCSTLRLHIPPGTLPSPSPVDPFNFILLERNKQSDGSKGQVMIEVIHIIFNIFLLHVCMANVR